MLSHDPGRNGAHLQSVVDEVAAIVGVQGTSCPGDTASVSRTLEQIMTLLGLGNSHTQAEELLKTNEVLQSMDNGSVNELLREEFRDHVKDVET